MSPAPQPPFVPGQRHSIPLAPGIELAFRYIPPTGPEGFRMGSRGQGPNEEPVHRVRIEHGFWLGETPVTQAQFAVWTAAVGTRVHRNEFDGHPDHPAETLAWFQAVKFGDWLTQQLQANRGFPGEASLVCLPTEAEWEYGCRAGSDTDFYSGDGEAALTRVGWYADNASDTTHAVGELSEVHPWGLRGMHGNVAEMCHDEWGSEWGQPSPRYRQAIDGDVDSGAASRTADYARGMEALLRCNQVRLLRGGSWGFAPMGCRSAYREWLQPEIRFAFVGFRVCLAPGPAQAG